MNPLYALPPWIIATLGAAVILGFFSLVFYKENLFSRWAEYSVIGLSIAYTTVVLTWRLDDILLKPILAGNVSLLIPLALGLLTYAQFSRNAKWITRWPLAILTGVGLALNVRGVPTSMFIVQIRAVAVPLTTGNAFDIINALIVVVGVITIMSYFTFTREHTGPLGISAKIGRLYMMLAFGGMFGMSLVSQGMFLINAFVYLLQNWLHLIAV
jgi:hypothetical protein